VFIFRSSSPSAESQPQRRIIPKLKALFTLSYRRGHAGAVGVLRSPFHRVDSRASLVRRIGYMARRWSGADHDGGCCCSSRRRCSVRSACSARVFVLASGITTVQCREPADFDAGPRSTAAADDLAQGSTRSARRCSLRRSILILGSLATIDPATLSGAALDAFRASRPVVVHTYMAWPSRSSSWLRGVAAENGLVEVAVPPTPILRAFNLLTRAALRLRIAVHFSLCGRRSRDRFSLIVNYLMQRA